MIHVDPLNAEKKAAAVWLFVFTMSFAASLFRKFI